MKAQIRAVSNTKTITINKWNLLIIEGPYAYRDFTISAPENGWQNIEWYPDHNVIADSLYKGTFAFTYGKETVFQTVEVGDLKNVIGTFIFTDSDNHRLHDLQFVDTKIGQTTTRSLRCIYYKYLYSANGTGIAIMVDSITVDNDNFLFEWKGNQFDQSPPPIPVLFPNNQIIVKFAPKEKGPQSAILKIHYNRGAVAYIRLFGNKKEIKAKTNLNVVSPNGGELFTPCQDTIITWKGNVKSIPTKVDISYDNGDTWTFIDSITADTLRWKVPPILASDKAKIRVSQDFTNDEPFIFAIGSSVYSVDYNYNATKALSFSIGSIYEWDLVKLDNSRIKYDLQSRTNRQVPIAIKYISQDKFAAIYSVGNYDSLAIFEVNNPIPIHKERFTDYKPKDIYPLPDKNEFIIMPIGKSYFSVYDNQTFAKKQDVVYNEIITDIGIAKDTNLMVVSGIDGKVLVLSKSDFQTKDSIEFYRTPMIDKVSVSPAGKFVGVSSIVRANNGRTNSMLWDIETKTIITSLNISGSQAVDIGFSPTGNMAIFAYQFQNQINIFDLNRSVWNGIIEAFQDPVYGLSYSSQNNSFLVSSVGNNGNKLKQYFFTFPETDESDKTFRIVNPIIEKKTIDLSDGYIFNESKKAFNVQFCNVGEVPLFIEDAYFKNSVHFALDNFSLPDTLLPGDCAEFTVIFNPQDTGAISDSLIIASCSINYPIYIKGNGLNRNIEFMVNKFDLGEICISDTSQITTEIFRNADPVPLLFNRFDVDSSSVFSFSNYPQDTLLQPGQTITATIEGVPNRVGYLESNYWVLHSNQEKYKASAKLSIVGIGSLIEISHDTLPFIPEQRIRRLKVKNIGSQDVTITNISLTPSTDFKLNTTTPITILQGETKEIEVEWIGNNTDVSATMRIEATPCLSQSIITIVDYKADSKITINDTQADPLDTTSISISYVNNENANYGGLREFEAIVTIDPKIFIPEYAVSEYGEAKIENLGIKNDRREMKLTVNGDFPASGTIAKIVGYPGLSDKTTSSIWFDVDNSKFWGVSTNSATRTGLFTLLLTCNDQTILHNLTNIETITPNPVSTSTVIEIANGEDGLYELILTSNDGKVLYSQKIRLLKGDNLIKCDFSDFETGNYIISVKQGNILSSKNLMIVK